MKKVLILILLLIISFSGYNYQKPVQPVNSVTSIQPSDDSKNTNSKNNEPPWMKAYYVYILRNSFSTEVKLIDLNFDGTPELLSCQYADGSRYYNIGAYYKNSKVISFYVKEVSDFAGTYIKSDGSQYWYTRSFPFSLHRWPETSMIFSGYNFLSLTDIKEDKLIEVYFNDPYDDTDYSKLHISILKGGKKVKLTSREYSLYKNWYVNIDNGESSLIILPYIKGMESNLNIKPQKQVDIDFSKYCVDTTKLKYEEFRTEMSKWYSK